MKMSWAAPCPDLEEQRGGPCGWSKEREGGSEGRTGLGQVMQDRFGAIIPRRRELEWLKEDAGAGPDSGPHGPSWLTWAGPTGLQGWEERAGSGKKVLVQGANDGAGPEDIDGEVDASWVDCGYRAKAVSSGWAVGGGKRKVEDDAACLNWAIWMVELP